MNFGKSALIALVSLASFVTPAVAASSDQVSHIVRLVTEPSKCVRVVYAGETVEFSVNRRVYNVTYNQRKNAIAIFARGSNDQDGAIYYDVGLTGLTDRSEDQKKYDADVARIVQGPIDCSVPGV